MANRSIKNNWAHSLILILLPVSLLFAQNPDVTMPNVGAPAGKDVFIDVQVSDLTGLQVFSMDLKILYDATILKYLQVSNSGTISSIWGSPTINNQPGQLSIAFAGVDPLVGSGKLIRIQFHVSESAGVGATSQLTFLSFQFNEGQPAANIHDGLFTVTTDLEAPRLVGSPKIQDQNYHSVKIKFNTDEPSTVELFYGESVNYDRSVQDFNLIKSHTLGLSNLKETTTYHYQIKLTDSLGNGPRSSADYTFKTRDVYLNLPVLTADPGTNIEIPVTVPDLSPLNITKVNLAVAFDPQQVQISGVSTSSTLLSGWASPQVTITQNLISFAAENSSPVSGSGNLIIIKGKIPAAAGLNKTSNLSWQTNELNGGAIRLIPRDGTLTVKDRIAPVITTGPQVSSVETNSVILTWQTNEPANSLVDYGTDDSYAFHLNEEEFVKEHEINLTNLSAGTLYHYRIGGKDESGNGPSWSADFTFTTATGAVIVKIPDSSATVGSTIWLPIRTTDLSNYSVVNWNGLIGFDANVLDYSGIDRNGTLTQGWNDVQVFQHPGFLSISASGSTPLSGSGELIKIGFQIKPVEGQKSTSVELLRFVFDNNWPTTSLRNGQLTINGTQDREAPQIISGPFVDQISGNSARIYWKTNERSNSRVDYGTAQNYGQNLSSPRLDSLHFISLTGLQPNTIYHYRVNSTDAAGNISAYSADSTFTTLPGNSVMVTIPVREVNPGQTFDLPIQTGSLDGLNVFSSDLTVSYDPSFLTAQSVLSSGTLSASWGDPVYSLFPGQVVIATGGIKPLQGSGDLVKIRFRAALEAPAGGRYVIRFDAFQFNEGNPSTTYRSGIIKINDTVAPKLLSGPDVVDIRTNSAIITWQTDEPANSKISFGIQTTDEFSSGSSILSRFHSILLDGLQTNTTYKFKISSVDSAGNGYQSSRQFEFKTGTIDQIRLKAANSSADRDQDFEMPVTISGNSNRPVSSINFELMFDSRIISLRNILLMAPGTGNWQVNFNELNPGTYEVSLDGNQPLTASGEFFRLLFHSLNAAYSSTSAVTLQNIFINHDSTNITAESGLFELIDKTPPVFSVLPNVSQIREKSALISWQSDEPVRSVVVYGAVGGKLDTLALNDPGTTFSYDFTNLNPLTDYRFKVGIVDLNSNGPVWSEFSQFKTTAGNEVDISIADTSSAIGSIISLPVRIGVSANLAIDAYRFTLLFDHELLNFMEPVVINSLTGSWPAPVFTIHGDTLELTHSGASFNQAGTLIFLKFQLKNKIKHNEIVLLRFMEFVLNNGAPPVAVKNGSITGQDLSAPVFLSDPQVVSSRLKSVLIEVKTDEFSRLDIFYGESRTDLNKKLEIAGFDTSHQVEIVDLLPNHSYFFRAEVYDSLNNGPGVSTIVPFQTLQASVSLSIPDTTGKVGGEIFVPVFISDVTDFDITKFNLEINYNPQKLTPLGMSVTGTLTENWGSGSFSSAGRTITIANSGSNVLTGEGALFFLQFLISETATINDTTQLTFGAVQIQDGIFPGVPNPGIIQFEAGAAQQDVFVSFPDTTLSAEASPEIALRVSDLTGLQISAYSFIVVFDRTLLNLKQIIVTNTLSADWGAPQIYFVGDSLFVTASGSKVLSGAGDLLLFQFEIRPDTPAGSKSALRLSDFKFNGGKPGAIVRDGSVTIQGKPTKIIGSVKDKRQTSLVIAGATVSALDQANHIAGQAVTDNSGHFEITGLNWQNSYKLAARKEGYSPSDTLTGISPDFSERTIFLLKQDGFIAGDIKNTEGQPVENALILADNSHGNFGSASSDQNGAFKIENLDRRFPFKLSITKSGYNTLTIASVGVDTSLNIVMGFQYGKIYGRTVNSQNQPEPGVTIRFFYVSSGMLVKELVTDGDGHFSQDNLRADVYLITAQKPNFISTPKQHIVDLNNQLEKRIEFQLKTYTLASLRITGDISVPNDQPSQFSYTALSEDGETIDNLTGLHWNIAPQMAGKIVDGVFSPDSSFLGEAAIFLYENSGFADTARISIYANIRSDKSYDLHDLNGMEIQIPAHAVQTSVPVRFDSEKPQSIKGSTRAYQVVGNGYDFKPDGTRFLSKLLLRLPIPQEFVSEQLTVGRWDPDRAKWVILGGTKVPGKNQIEVAIDHFSLFALLLESKPLGIHDVHFSPNPFSPVVDTDNDGNPGVKIEFTVTSRTIRQPFVNLKIYSMLGQLVKELLINEPVDKAQPQAVFWDGLTDLGRQARNGRYVVQIEVKDEQGTETYLGQVVLIK